MVEYGGGINNGPAGQVGGGNAPSFGGGGDGDVFTRVGNFVNDGINFLSAQPIEVLVAGFFVVLIGLVVLKRAF